MAGYFCFNSSTANIKAGVVFRAAFLLIICYDLNLLLVLRPAWLVLVLAKNHPLWHYAPNSNHRGDQLGWCMHRFVLLHKKLRHIGWTTTNGPFAHCYRIQTDPMFRNGVICCTIGVHLVSSGAHVKSSIRDLVQGQRPKFGSGCNAACYVYSKNVTCVHCRYVCHFFFCLFSNIPLCTSTFRQNP